MGQNEKSIMQKIMIRRGMISNVIVKGISMEPLLFSGDKLNIVISEKYEIGDVVIFLYQNKLTVHRILEISDNMAITKGDNAFNIEAVPIREILGKAVSFERNGKIKLIEYNIFIKHIVEVSKKVHSDWINNCKNIILTSRGSNYKKLRDLLNRYIKETRSRGETVGKCGQQYTN